MFEELFSRGGLSLERLRTLVEIVDAGSIARAAKGDPVRQSLYSRQLKELETFVGMKLSARHGRGLTLNPEGLLLASLGRQSLKSLDDYLQRLKKNTATYAIAGGEFYLQTLLIPALGQVKAKLKQETAMEIDFVCHNKRNRDILDGLAHASFDFGLLTHVDGMPASLNAMPLFSFEYRLYVPRQLCKASDSSVAEERLLALPIAAQEHESTYTKNIGALCKAGETFKPSLICTSVTQLISAVKSGAYAAVLPSFTKPQFPDKHFLEMPFSKAKALHQTLYLAWNPSQESIRAEMPRMREVLCAAMKDYDALITPTKETH